MFKKNSASLALFFIIILFSSAFYNISDIYLSNIFKKNKINITPQINLKTDTLACMQDKSFTSEQDVCWKSPQKDSLNIFSAKVSSCFVFWQLREIASPCDWSIASFYYQIKEPNEKSHTLIKKTSFTILLEWLLVLGLTLPIVIVCYSRYDYFVKPSGNTNFHIIDWSLNAPPIIGVLANLFSFAKLLADESGSLDANFLKSFHEAVITTIIGGIIYIINLFVKAFVKDE